MKPQSNQVIKKIIKSCGNRQAVLMVGEWEEKIINEIKKNENIVQYIKLDSELSSLSENSFTRIIVDYSLFFNDKENFYKEIRKLLLPTGILIISANVEDGALTKFIKKIKTFFNKQEKKHVDKNIILLSSPKVLQDEIHDNGFLIDGYYGYPGNGLIMIAQIQNKEVTTLFSSNEQETIKI